ncbi:MAG: hypothetical protein C75L2_00020055 [Leptospirillum sp. Group II 'C75']|jgi:hypothetical protein|uniref:hypothetical protein n=1 Tax=Leptospirillum sp. Group II 'CF-1' TaxID=1660083 RepID=UPI00029CD499|nr:hypothetical protein [Leptospirillum sp. Group II 'CF-1']AKS22849.1 hypothetical protein ABH19_02430 [Leptospirillum sp. Group II 'CF-1']EIJ75157.1 MAG: hypothetical protein C75L2_00020055 [Leptospirillum sp. Group II 'C75']
MTRFFGFSVAAFVLSGCVSATDMELPDVTPGTFVSLPYSSVPGTLCRTPVPRPSFLVVSRTVRTLAGPGGTVREVSIPTGTAFGIWSDKVRIAGIREYLNQLARERKVNVKVRLIRVGKSTPYLVRSFPVTTNRPFLAAAWSSGNETRTVSAFFVKTGRTVSPVLSLSLLAPGFRSCRTATPDFPGPDITFNAGQAIVEKGATNLELTWETSDGKH